MGRPSKGDRDAFTVKPPRPLADVIKRNATSLGMSYGDYIVLLVAEALGMPEHAPQPTKVVDPDALRRPVRTPVPPRTQDTGVRRLPRGTRVNPVRATYVVEDQRKRQFEAIAERSGMTASAFLEMLWDRLEGELTDDGVPSWLGAALEVRGGSLASS